MLQCLFAHSLRKFSMRDWGIEQKWMSILLPLLLLYNGELQVKGHSVRRIIVVSCVGCKCYIKKIVYLEVPVCFLMCFVALVR